MTALFADIVGFTALAERRDPEEVKHLVDRAFALLTADVTAFGGVVDKIVGDQIVALFGAPVAHSDDAERAVRAGSADAGHDRRAGRRSRPRERSGSGSGSTPGRCWSAARPPAATTRPWVT